jgi:hypothetical protein
LIALRSIFSFSWGWGFIKQRIISILFERIEMTKEEYNCKYCGRKISKFDYETHKGYCGKCREIKDWKVILSDLKEYEK